MRAMPPPEPSPPRTHMSDLDQVLGYAARGWHAFPLKPRSKVPATRRGFYDATTNPAKLERWFARGYPYNVGIRTGLLSGVLVFDTDGIRGTTSWRRLERDYGPLPRTLTSQTAKGSHLWFSIDVPVSCNVEKIAPSIDIRANGGYVVVPPSIHPNGMVYEWIDYSVPLAPTPDWLIVLALHKPVPRAREINCDKCVTAEPTSAHITATSSAAYGRAALEREIQKLTLASSGHRNHELNRVSFRLHQLVAGEELPPGIVQQQLMAAAEANGLLADDGLMAVQATINSGANAGMRFPRDRHGRR